ncbi:TPA: DUF6236 family protein [Photobacterium damselae]
MQKGLVIGPQYSGDSRSLSISSSEPDSVSLRKYVLLWDMLDLPNNNIIRMGGSDDIVLLEQEGILKRSEMKVNINGFISAELYSTIQYMALEANNTLNDEEWSLAQSSDGLFQLPKNAISQPAIEFDIYNALPIPTSDVPLERVLDFKLKRHELLLDLRDSIDEAVARILVSDHIEKSKTKEIKRIHRNLNELSRTLDESKIDKVKHSLKSFISHEAVATAGALSLIDIPAQFEPYRASFNIVALGTAGINIAVKSFFSSPTIPSHLRQYAYLSYASKEFKKYN